jgi:hypothetical protein
MGREKRTSTLHPAGWTEGYEPGTNQHTCPSGGICDRRVTQEAIQEATQESFPMQRPIPAVFMRGGTSKAIMFHARDLPEDRQAWDHIFTAAMGSPDPYGRQLDGMGGGVSSLSKVCVLAPSARDDADIDYTFA